MAPEGVGESETLSGASSTVPARHCREGMLSGTAAWTFDLDDTAVATDEALTLTGLAAPVAYELLEWDGTSATALEAYEWDGSTLSDLEALLTE